MAERAAAFDQSAERHGSEVLLFFDGIGGARRRLRFCEEGLDRRLELSGEPHAGDGVELAVQAPHALVVDPGGHRSESTLPLEPGHAVVGEDS